MLDATHIGLALGAAGFAGSLISAARRRELRQTLLGAALLCAAGLLLYLAAAWIAGGR
jgi:hypothetical protein